MPIVRVMTQSPNVADLTESELESEADPRVIDFTDAEVDDLFSALSSATAREILQQLRDAPAHPAALAEDTDTSVQNVHYHLSKLTDAGVVTVVDTTYSEKGREMNIYAPASEPLVLVSGSENDREDLVESLSKFLAGVGGVALLSVLIQKFIDTVFYPGSPHPITTGTGQYAAPPMTNVAPPIGLYVFVAGFVCLAVWLVRRRM